MLPTVGLYPVHYTGSVEISDKIESRKTLQVDRTGHLDSLANLVRGSLITFYNFGQQKDTIKSHLRDMVREKMGRKLQSGVNSLAMTITSIALPICRPH